MKPCECDECDWYHEGYCTENMTDCTAKSNDDLMTEDEYEELMKKATPGVGGEPDKLESDVESIHHKLLYEFGRDKSWYAMYLAILKYVKEQGCVIPSNYEDAMYFVSANEMLENSIKRYEKNQSEATPGGK